MNIKDAAFIVSEKSINMCRYRTYPPHTDHFGELYAYLQGMIMPPTSEKLKGHIACGGLSVRPSVRASVRLKFKIEF